MSVYLSSLCRLCAEIRDTDINIFMHDDQVNLLEAISTYLCINITINDQLPMHVCQKCRTKMISFNKFAIKCNESQITLNAILNQSLSADKVLENVKSEIKDDDILEDVKTELGDDFSIKSEDFSDNCNDDNDDFIPISQLVKKKSRKKRTKNDSIKSKRVKKSNSSIEQNVENLDDISLIDEMNGEDLKTSADDDIERKKRKGRSIMINNSFFKFFCHVCSGHFTNWSALKNHTKEDHHTKAKVLCMCGKYLYTRHAINRHIVKHDKSVGIKCDSCDKTFSNEKALQAHTPVHLPKDQYPHVCSHCAKRFATMFSLKIHERTHIPKELRYIHPCEICGVKFTSKSSVKAHISAVHEKHRPFVCDVCGHAFNNKGNLQDHRVLHSDEKLHSCPKCPKRFKTKGTLQRHLDCHGGTSYKCPKCPALLNSRRTLRMHMYVHEDLCRYICAFCNKGYKRRKSLKSHMNLHTGERPYSCPWCSRTFADNSNCRIHKRRMHPTELAEYEAIHGNAHDVTKDDVAEEKKVIYNMTFKPYDTRPIVVPQLDVKPDLMKSLEESNP